MAIFSETHNSSTQAAAYSSTDPCEIHEGFAPHRNFGSTKTAGRCATVHQMHHDMEGPEDSNVVLASLAHDARNMFTALSLYCDLLAEPGVLPSQSLHYATELKIVSQTGAKLAARLGAATEGRVELPPVFSSPSVEIEQPVVRRACKKQTIREGSGLQC